MDIFHLDKRAYGWVFAGLSVAFIGLSQFNSLLLRRYTSQQIIRVRAGGTGLVAAVFWVARWRVCWGWLRRSGFYSCSLPVFGFTNPNAAALAMAPFARNAGQLRRCWGVAVGGWGAGFNWGQCVCRWDDDADGGDHRRDVFLALGVFGPGAEEVGGGGDGWGGAWAGGH